MLRALCLVVLFPFLLGLSPKADLGGCSNPVVVLLPAPPDGICPCVASVKTPTSSLTFFCQDGTVGCSITYPNPTYNNGDCLLDCATLTSHCKQNFPNVDVRFFNCLGGANGGAWTDSPQYNNGVRSFVGNKVYDLTNEALCNHSGADGIGSIELWSAQTAGVRYAYVTIVWTCKPCLQ